MKKIKSFIALILGLSVLFSFGSAKAVSIDDLQAQVAQLMQIVAELQAQLTAQITAGSGYSAVTSTCFTNNLKFGVRSQEAMSLQSILKEAGFYPEGLITGYFGQLTKKAVTNFQSGYGITEENGAGYVGQKTLDKLNALFCNSQFVTPAGSTVPVEGSGSSNNNQNSNSNSYSWQNGQNLTVASLGVDNSKTFLDATNVEIAKFNFKAGNETLKIATLGANLLCSKQNVVVKNVKILINGVQIGNTDASVLCNGSEMSLWGNFGNSFTISSGQGSIVSIVADLASSGGLAAGDSIKVSLAAGYDNCQKMQTGGYLSTPAVSGGVVSVLGSGNIFLSVSKNPSLEDVKISVDSGAAGEANVKIGSFVVSPVGEGVSLTQIVLKDETGQFGDYYSGLRVKLGSDQIGMNYSSFTNVANQMYSFVPAGNIRLASDQQMIFDVYADVKNPNSSSWLSVPAVVLKSIYSSGVSSGQAADYTTGLQLQNVYVNSSSTSISAGKLTVSLSSDSPLAGQVISGKEYNFVNLLLTADSQEDIKVDKLIISVQASANGADAADLTDLRIYDITNGAQTMVAGPVYSLSNFSAFPGTMYAEFSGLSFIIPKGTQKKISVKAKVTPWFNGQSGDTQKVGILPSYTDADISNAVRATGLSSGKELDQTNGGLSIASSMGNTFTVYRVKPSVSVNFDPNNLPQTNHVVGSFVINNEVNDGSYPVKIKNLKVALNASNLSDGPAAMRVFSIYKNAPLISGNKIAELTLQCGLSNGCSYGGVLDFSGGPAIVSGWNGYTVANSSGLISTEISSGGSKEFSLVADTTASKLNQSAVASLQTILNQGGIVWSDGSVDVNYVDGLPTNATSYNSVSF